MGSFRLCQIRDLAQFGDSLFLGGRSPCQNILLYFCKGNKKTRNGDIGQQTRLASRHSSEPLSTNDFCNLIAQMISQSDCANDYFIRRGSLQGYFLQEGPLRYFYADRRRWHGTHDQKGELNASSIKESADVGTSQFWKRVTGCKCKSDEEREGREMGKGGGREKRGR